MQWRTLAPDRSRATAVAEVVARISGDAETVAALDQGLADIVEAVAENFPENVFWDFDRLVAALVARRDADAIRRAAAQVVRLQRGFGRHGVISFRYAHDFLYGFDWARWVARDAAARACVGPFDPQFLDYLEARMRELVSLIEADDVKYPQLDAAQRWRNPFQFSREPADEARLFEWLAAAGQLPVEAWCFDGAEDWREPYSALRREAATALGIANA